MSSVSALPDSTDDLSLSPELPTDAALFEGGDENGADVEDDAADASADGAASDAAVGSGIADSVQAVEAPQIQFRDENTSLHELSRRRKGRIILDPIWQRRFVWDKTRASKLIESCLCKFPIPVIFLSETHDSKYEVIDGLQRLTSWYQFENNEFALRGLTTLPHLNGKRFKDLTPEEQARLEDYAMRVYVLGKDTPTDTLFDIFERLNTGGAALNPMEVRNCIFRGTLMERLKRMANYAPFRQATRLPSNKRMDDLTLVLRFLAFSNMTTDRARDGVKAFLNMFLKDYQNAASDRLDDFERRFEKSMRACWTVFGDRAFRMYRKVSDKRPDFGYALKTNASVFQVVAVSFAGYREQALIARADEIRAALQDLMLTDDRWCHAVSYRTSRYDNIVYAFTTWNARLAVIMESESARPTARLFSQEVRVRMFTQDPTCAICLNQILSLDDAQVDHIVPFSHGGATEEANARLTHRACNQSRERRPLDPVATAA